MSIWKDMRQKSLGQEMRLEKDCLYNKGPGYHIIEEGKYRNVHYFVVANNGYPYIKIYLPLRISFAASFDKIDIETSDGQTFELTNFPTNEHYILTYSFNKDGDYVDSMGSGKGQPGKRYTFNKVKNYAQEFINNLLAKQDEFLNSK